MQLQNSALVRPLEAQFRLVLDDIARSRGWPASSDSRLGALVRELSAAYNGPSGAPPRTSSSLAARLGFSFARDVPKGAAAVRELVVSGLLSIPEARPLSILDVGAGLGATSRGVVRALAACGAVGSVVVDAVDIDADALELAVQIARARPREEGVGLELRVVRASARDPLPVHGPYDLVVLGHVLSELDRDQGDERVSHHVALVEQCAGLLRNDGAVVVIEPALRERTRHLHAVRDAILAQPGVALAVFAPCVHSAPCPMLRDRDAWCHEDLDVDLPEWLTPVARAAGLRWQGLTFSYLVLRPEGRPAAGGSPARALRVVSSAIVTKGKRELFLCGRFEGGDGASYVRVMRLDRHRSPSNAVWDAAVRGDVVEVTPALPIARPRIEAASVVARALPAPGRD